MGAITKNGAGAAAPVDIMAYAGGMTAEQVRLVKTSVITGGTRPVTDNELALFLTVCSRRGLDPFSGQIYGIMRKSKQKDGTWVEKLVIQVGIDGYRLLAEKTGKYEGMIGPYWCGPDGQWVDVWLSESPPAAAKVGILRSGCREPFWGVTTYREFCEKRDGQPVGKWKDMPALMLAKVAEAAAIRKAFPQAVGGLTTPETVGADTETDAITDGDRTLARIVQQHEDEKGARGRQPWREELDDIVEGQVMRVDDAPPTAAQDSASTPDPIPGLIAAAATVQEVEALIAHEAWDAGRHSPLATARLAHLVGCALDKIDWSKPASAIEKTLAAAAIRLDPLPIDIQAVSVAQDKLEAARQRLETLRAPAAAGAM